MKEIVNVSKKPQMFNKLFFGDSGNYNRIDIINYDIFKKLAEASESNTWFVNELDFSKDGRMFHKIPESAANKFKKTVVYQSLMDSAVPNIYYDLVNITNDTYLKYLYARIGTEEEIHSMSYSAGLSQMFGPEAQDIMDMVYVDNMIAKRVNSEKYDAEIFRRKLYEYLQNDNIEPEDDFKQILLILLVRVFLLENIKFPFSFFTTWSINKAYDNNIQGFSQLLKLIAHDELTIHTTTFKHVYKLLKNDKDNLHGFYEIINDGKVRNIFSQMIEETVELEIEWAKYLLEDGNEPGFTYKICEEFIQYRADLSCRALNIPLIYKIKKNDTLEWFDKYRQLNNTQVALQEAKTTNYQKSSLKFDFDSNQDRWDKYKSIYNISNNSEKEDA